MSADAHEQSRLPSFRAVLPPELEGLSDEPFGPPLSVDEHQAKLRADLEALEAADGE